MKKLIANFKTNMNLQDFKNYAIYLSANLENYKDKVRIALPFTHIALGGFLFNNNMVEVGGQNIFEEKSCTGEISAEILKSAGANFVILGHSDRRKRFKETDKQINKKIKLALAQGLKVVLCVGEEIAGADRKESNAFVKKQLEEALKGLYENELESVTIAYEPVYAIGTGKLPLNRAIESAVLNIRKVIEALYSKKTASEIEVVYGGSLNSRNIKSVLSVKGLDGGLIGGACLNAREFCDMIKEVE